jgi:predicted tellurium resistance membrane protein TerC
MWLEYAWTVVVLVFLEGLLSADNALVLALLVKDLPPRKRLRALTYGLVGAYVFRFAAILFATILLQVWQFQAFGAAYLFYVALRHLLKAQSPAATPAQSPRPASGERSCGWSSWILPLRWIPSWRRWHW